MRSKFVYVGMVDNSTTDSFIKDNVIVNKYRQIVCFSSQSKIFGKYVDDRGIN